MPGQIYVLRGIKTGSGKRGNLHDSVLQVASYEPLITSNKVM